MDEEKAPLKANSYEVNGLKKADHKRDSKKLRLCKKDMMARGLTRTDFLGSHFATACSLLLEEKLCRAPTRRRNLSILLDQIDDDVVLLSKLIFNL